VGCFLGAGLAGAGLLAVAAWPPLFFFCAPVAALGRLRGPPPPNFPWAEVVPAVIIAMLSARPSVLFVFICCSPPTGAGTRIVGQYYVRAVCGASASDQRLR